MITLYHTPGSRSMRVRWLCEEMGVPLTVRAVNFREPDSEFLALSPMQAVPAMTENDLVMSESIAMMLYIADKYGPTDLKLSVSDPEYGRMLDWLLFAEATIGSQVNPIIRTRFRGPEDAKNNWTVVNCAERCVQALGVLAEGLKDRDYIAGGRFTMADIALGHAIGIARGFLGMEDAVADHVKAYHARLCERPAYQRAAA